jgi:hypothetical protein
MNIVSASIGIDIGMKNYGISIIEWKGDNKWKPLLIGVFDTKIKKGCGTVKISVLMNKFLDDILISLSNVADKIECVIIESQPGKRSIMERILQSTISYFVMKIGIKNVFTKRSGPKFSVGGIKCPSTYKKRKNMSIIIGHRCLSQFPIWIKYISDNFMKTDDIYDSLLLILHYYKYYYIL